MKDAPMIFVLIFVQIVSLALNVALALSYLSRCGECQCPASVRRAPRRPSR